MEYLLAAITCSVLVAHILKFSGSRGWNVSALFAINYLVGSIIALSGAGWRISSLFLSPAYVLLGIAMGALFIGTFFIYSKAISTCGLAVAVAFMRLAAVLPTLGSILVFGESPSPFQVLGIALTFFALPWSQATPIRKADLIALKGTALQWGLLLFVSFGATEFLFKLQREWYPHQNPYAFLSLVFPTAAVIGLAVARKGRTPTHPRLILTGLVLGTVNMFSAYFFYRSLSTLPGILAYPSQGVGVIFLTLLTGMWLWKEKLHLRQVVFLILAGLSLVLMYQ